MTKSVNVSSNELGVALSSPAGMISVAWDDVPAMLEDIRKAMASRGVNEHFARGVAVGIAVSPR